MAHIFDITAPGDAVSLGPSGTGEIPFTVTNVSASAVRGRAVLGPEKSAVLPWLKLAGEQERLLQPKQTDTFLVKVAVPPGTNAGDYSFRLDIVSVARPDEDSTQGPAIKIPVILAPPPPKPFPWWILAVAAVVIGGLSYAALKLIPGNKVTVPDLRGKTVEQAQALLMPLHLKLGTQTKTPVAQSDVDHIVGQTPAYDPKNPTLTPPGSIVDVQIGIANTAPPIARVAPPAGRAGIVNADTSLCLGPVNGLTDNNRGIVGSRCDGDPARLWTFDGGEGDVVHIVNSSSGRCLTVAGGNTVPADPSVQYNCDEDPSRRWHFVALDGTTFQLQNVNSHMCLTMPANAVAIQNPCGPLNSKWRLALAP
jgi:Ricin-type beta-trefoil lectin domain-like/PASTA domain